ncbi:MAG TPA: hypothetical protein VH477_15890 [Bryobacteraceae bacterium]|jgi:hypothetical protein
MKAAIVFLFAAVVAENSVNDRVIKANTPAEIRSIRAALVQEIWGEPWSAVQKEQPRAVDRNYEVQTGDALPEHLQNLRTVDRLQVGSDAAPSTVFVFYPAAKDTHKAVIVHQGHGCFLSDGGKRVEHVGLLIEKLLANGHTIAGMRMPLYQNPAHCGASRAHDKFFDAPPPRGSAVAYFMDPVARTVNYLSKQKGVGEIDMSGLSGGGWTTTLYAAIDPRIKKSFPVAGTLPLYMRGEHYNHDREQYDPSTYRIAGYKDLYVLGSTGPGRRQLQILNRYDDCCFGERQQKVVPPPYLEAVHEYEQDVESVVKKLGPGSFSVDIDETAHVHQVAENAIDNAILPALK